MEIDQESENLVEKPNDLRIKLRENFHRDHKFIRSSAFDKNRFLNNEILTEQDVTGICGRIKRRKHATEEDLIKLASAFYQSEANISAFIKITGGINVIVKEFIHSDRQLLAAQTLCNLSLGNDACCSKIATFAGVYLMIYIRNLTCVTFNKICIWTIQNLISSDGNKSLDILMSQELLENTLNIIENSGEAELQHEAIFMLDLILEKKLQEIDKIEEVTKTVLNYAVKARADYIGLQCLHRIISINGLNVDIEISLKLIKLLTDNVKKLSLGTPIVDLDEQSVYFSVKILLEMLGSNENLSAFTDHLLKTDTKLSTIINEAVKIPKYFILLSDLIRIIVRIQNLQQPVGTRYLEFDDIESNLRIPSFFEF